MTVVWGAGPSCSPSYSSSYSTESIGPRSSNSSTTPATSTPAASTSAASTATARTSIYATSTKESSGSSSGSQHRCSSSTPSGLFALHDQAKPGSSCILTSELLCIVSGSCCMGHEFPFIDSELLCCRWAAMWARLSRSSSQQEDQRKLFRSTRLTASGPLFLPLSVSVALFLALLSLSEHPALLLCQLLYLSASSSLLCSIPQLFYFFIFISCSLCLSAAHS